MQTDKKKKRNKIIKWIAISTLLTFLFVLGGAAIYINHLLNLIDIQDVGDFTLGDETITQLEPTYEDPDDNTGNTPDPSNPTPKPTPGNKKKRDINPDVINILLMGVDNKDAKSPSRSDSMMVATINKKTGEIKLTSLMRDMYVEIPGRELKNRINTGYFFGGPALAIKTVNRNFDLNIKHYVTIDFSGFTEVIDELGGVDITITDDEAKIIGLKKSGTHNLNGQQALAYSRIRKIGNDFARTQRQRTVFNSLFKKMKSTSILRIPGLLNKLLPYFETNLAKKDILSLTYEVLKSDTDNIETLRIPLDGAYRSESIRGMSVLVPDIERNTDAIHDFINK